MVSNNWGKQSTKKIEKKVDDKINLAVDLDVMSMKKLRNFAKKKGLKAKDTSRDELIEEIKQELEEKGEL